MYFVFPGAKDILMYKKILLLMLYFHIAVMVIDKNTFYKRISFLIIIPIIFFQNLENNMYYRTSENEGIRVLRFVENIAIKEEKNRGRYNINLTLDRGPLWTIRITGKNNRLQNGVR